MSFLTAPGCISLPPIASPAIRMSNGQPRSRAVGHGVDEPSRNAIGLGGFIPGKSETVPAAYLAMPACGHARTRSCQSSDPCTSAAAAFFGRSGSHSGSAAATAAGRDVVLGQFVPHHQSANLFDNTCKLAGSVCHLDITKCPAQAIA